MPLQTDQNIRLQEKENKEDKSQEDLDRKEMIRSRLADRVERLNTVCKASHWVNIVETYEQPKPEAYGRLLYCRIPKVGTTFTRTVLKQLFKSTKPNTTYTGRKKRYIIVREPYSRLASAYVDKFLLNQRFWMKFMYGVVLKGNDSEADSPKNISCGMSVSFPEYVKYLISAQTTGRGKNWHFHPMHELCGICREPYDYVTHLETLKDDLKYIYDSVNVTIDTEFSNEHQTMNEKCDDIFQLREAFRKCEKMCETQKRVWWSFQVRGLIPNSMEFPLKEKECDTITKDKLSALVWEAHIKSVGRFDKSKQKRESLVKLFLQVPLQDRMRLRDLYRGDFDLFGYDPEPSDIFPELHKSKNKK